MVSVVLNISDVFRRMINELPWVNWSELAREELIKQEKLQEDFERFKKLVSRSKLSKSDARVLADKVDEGILKELRKRFPGL